MRAIWSGSLSFGLLNIPVSLFSASKERALKFHMFDKKDNCPIAYKKVCRLDGHEVDQKNIVKGYEYEKGRYVMLDKGDFKKANVTKTGSIEILSFTDPQSIDEGYYEKPYFIIPEEKSAKAYILLRDAIEKTEKAGIGRFVLHEHEHIALIQPQKDFMMLIQLRYDDELNDPSQFSLPKSSYSKKELDMAVNLVESLTEKFKPEQYKDTYTNELMNIIKAKAKGKKITPVGQEPVPSPLDTDAVLKLLEDSMKKAKK